MIRLQGGSAVLACARGPASGFCNTLPHGEQLLLADDGDDAGRTGQRTAPLRCDSRPAGQPSYTVARQVPLPPASAAGYAECIDNTQEHPMGKYVIAWILGVPAVVLVLIYFFFR